MMAKYNIGEIYWVNFPFEENKTEKHRPAIIISDEEIAIMSMYVTSQHKERAYVIEITDWKEAGLAKPSWAKIDRVVGIDERNIDQKIGELSSDDLQKIMQLYAAIIKEDFHEFSLVAVMRNDKRYLQVYDERWQCWLFPYFRTADENKANVDKSISELLHISINTNYVAKTKHCKYSASDDVYKIYKHKLYFVSLDNLTEAIQEDEFEIDGIKFQWMSISKLESDLNIMKKNDDVIAFVKLKCGC